MSLHYQRWQEEREDTVSLPQGQGFILTTVEENERKLQEKAFSVLEFQGEKAYSLGQATEPGHLISLFSKEEFTRL